MAKDKRIDTYIEKSQPFAQPILLNIRELAHRALPDAQETSKWGVPHFTVDGKNVVGMVAFADHAGVLIASEDKAGGGMGSLGRLKSIDELPSDDELIRRFQASRDAVLDGKVSVRRAKAKPALALPQDFAGALATTPGAKKTFDGFTEAQRGDYLEWIAGAKRDATRKKRIATAVSWIAEGKRRNWKYENC